MRAAPPIFRRWTHGLYGMTAEAEDVATGTGESAQL